MSKPTNLKLWLVMKGIKQEWLARQTGLPSNTVSRIVNGQLPTLRNAQKIAHALKTTVDELWPLDDQLDEDGFAKE